MFVVKSDEKSIFLFYTGDLKDKNKKMLFLSKIKVLDGILYDKNRKLFMCNYSRRNLEKIYSYNKSGESIKMLIAKNNILKKAIRGSKNIGNGLKLKPFDYQREAISMIIESKRLLLVLPCGAGKTPIGIGAFDELHEKKLISNTGVFVVKASLKEQWKKEIEKFSKYSSSIIKTYSKIDSGKESRNKNNKKKLKEVKAYNKKAFAEQFDYDIIIINYETIRDDKRIKEKLKKINPDFVFADEVHMIKNCSSKRSKAMYSTFKNSKFRVGATATPVGKDSIEIFSIYKFVCPEIFNIKKEEFLKKYSYQNAYGDYYGLKRDFAQELYNIYDINYYRKYKCELLSLPKLITSSLYCSPSQKQINMDATLIEEIEKIKHNKSLLNKDNQKEEIKAEDSKILALTTFRQELSDSPELLSMSKSNFAKKFSFIEKSVSKVELCKTTIDSIVSEDINNQVCIYTKFSNMVKILIRELSKDKRLKISWFDGSINSKERYKRIYEDKWNILIMTDAGAEGINLSSCKYLIEYDVASSAMVQTQRRGRIERADSIHDTAIVYCLITSDMIDESLNNSIEKKKEVGRIL